MKISKKVLGASRWPRSFLNSAATVSSWWSPFRSKNKFELFWNVVFFALSLSLFCFPTPPQVHGIFPYSALAIVLPFGENVQKLKIVTKLVAVDYFWDPIRFLECSLMIFYWIFNALLWTTKSRHCCVVTAGCVSWSLPGKANHDT